MKGEERVGKGRGEGGGNEKGGGGIGPHFLGQVYALLNKRITYLLTYLLTYLHIVFVLWYGTLQVLQFVNDLVIQIV